MGGKDHVNPNKGVAAYHAGKSDKPIERRVQLLDDHERFITPTAVGVVGKKKKEEPKRPQHPNLELTAGMTAAALREAYVKLLNADPGQLGKDKLRIALCQPKVPSMTMIALET